jgi:hypothetical protein
MKTLNQILSGIVLTLGAAALFVTAYGWPVQIQERVKTETLTIEYHYPPVCPDFDNINTKPLREKDVIAALK